MYRKDAFFQITKYASINRGQLIHTLFRLHVLTNDTSQRLLCPLKEVIYTAVAKNANMKGIKIERGSNTCSKKNKVLEIISECYDMSNCYKYM
jgi:hypothetical protein